MSNEPVLHGLMAEFDSPRDLVKAAEAARHAGYRRMDAYTPYPIEEVIEALHVHDWRMPWVVVGGGIFGGLSGYGMQYFAQVIDYPLNVGGKPFHSWPMFIPVTFEMTILFAAFAAVFGMLALNGLPMPYHPVFNVKKFASYASRNKFFLCIESTDPKFDRAEVTRFLEGLKPSEIHEVAD